MFFNLRDEFSITKISGTKLLDLTISRIEMLFYSLLDGTMSKQYGIIDNLAHFYNKHMNCPTFDI